MRLNVLQVTVPVLKSLADKGEERLTSWLTGNVPALAPGARQTIINHYFS